MFRLFRNLKPMAWLLVLVVALVATQAISELYLPGRMSDIINNGIYYDYEPLYKFVEMPTPEGFEAVDSEKQMAGYNGDTIPVFEMADGFSTYDLKNTYTELFGYAIEFEFQDIPVSDSRELFDDVLMPFVNGLKKYQDPDKDFYDYSEAERAEIESAINRLIVFSTVPETGTVNINTFLHLEEDANDASEESEGLWGNETVKRLIASCFCNMKHSKYGNAMPIPVDRDGNRLAVDAYGQAIEQHKVQYEYDAETERYSVLPDYETIICNRVLAYAYKYRDGEKWVNSKLGLSLAAAQSEADSYNIKNGLEIKEKSAAEQFFDRLSFVPTEREKKGGLNALTAEDMMTPDGQTIQMSDFNYIIKRGGQMLLLSLLSCAAGIAAAFVSAIIASRFSAVIRSKIFCKVETFSLVEFDRFSTASLITRSTNDINQIQNVFLLILRTALAAPITIVGGMILSLRKNVDMTVVILYALPALVLGCALAIWVVFPIFDVIQKKVDRLTLIMRENLTGIRVVRAFNQQERERIRFNETNDSLTKSAITVNRWTAVMAPAITVVMNCVGVGIIAVAAGLVAANDPSVNVGSMMAVSQYVTLIMTALVMLAVVCVMFPRAATSAKRINEVMDTQLAITDTENAEDKSDGRGRVEFRNVSFKYSDEAQHYILSDLNFVAEKGKVTAIVGGTGSGKSSIIQLIPRFYDVGVGEVLVNGQNVKEMPQDKLREKIGYVPQKSVLFAGTIRENMRYGKEDATDGEIWDALKIAQSDGFVSEKEGGLSGRVEQGGRNFSGGQKQRLAIARAIVRRPEIYIFDDSFSALDFMTDKKLRAALKEVTEDSAVIIVAQRIGTVLDADNILVLEGGRIVGQGRHGQLIKNCEVYRDIALSQMSKEELGL